MQWLSLPLALLVTKGPGPDSILFSGLNYTLHSILTQRQYNSEVCDSFVHTFKGVMG